LFRKNWVLCLAFTRSPSNTDSEVARLVQKVVKKSTGGKFECEQVVSTVIADVAAIGVSTNMGIKEREACGMHQGDKLGASATGKLLRTKNKVVVNPFDEGMHLDLLFAPDE